MSFHADRRKNGRRHRRIGRHEEVNSRFAQLCERALHYSWIIDCKLILYLRLCLDWHIRTYSTSYPHNAVASMFCINGSWRGRRLEVSWIDERVLSSQERLFLEELLCLSNTLLVFLLVKNATKEQEKSGWWITDDVTNVFYTSKKCRKHQKTECFNEYRYSSMIVLFFAGWDCPVWGKQFRSSIFCPLKMSTSRISITSLW